MNQAKIELNAAVAQKVLDTVDAGLVHGIGTPVPGKMCVEATVCYAMGLPHSDDPACVGAVVRAFKIQLNDSRWSSNAARAKGLRRIAIAQLGSDRIDQVEFVRLLAVETIKQIVPIALRAVAGVQKDTARAMALEVAALRCEQEGTREAALDGKIAAAYAVYAATYATYATYATNAANATNAVDAAVYATNAAAYAANATNAADAAVYATNAAAYAANAADAAAYAAAVKRDSVLVLMADIGVGILVKLGTQGCQWLHLAD